MKMNLVFVFVLFVFVLVLVVVDWLFVVVVWFRRLSLICWNSHVGGGVHPVVVKVLSELVVELADGSLEVTR